MLIKPECVVSFLSRVPRSQMKQILMLYPDRQKNFFAGWLDWANIRLLGDC
jgi:hypothetical protein